VHDEDTAWFGAVLAVGAAAMLVLALLFAEAFLRARAEAWPPLGVPRIPRVLPTLNLAVIAGACGLLHRAVRDQVKSSRSEDRSHRSSAFEVRGPVAATSGAPDNVGPPIQFDLKTNIRLGLALTLGALFLGLDAVLWRLLWANGFTLTQTGAYGALFYALTFTHAALTLLGLCGLAALLRRPGATGRRGWSLYWDFLGVAWAAIVVGVVWL
jgi:cytochrome c oxidase subunit 3